LLELRLRIDKMPRPEKGGRGEKGKKSPPILHTKLRSQEI